MIPIPIKPAALAALYNGAQILDSGQTHFDYLKGWRFD